MNQCKQTFTNEPSLQESCSNRSLFQRSVVYLSKEKDLCWRSPFSHSHCQNSWQTSIRATKWIANLHKQDITAVDTKWETSLSLRYEGETPLTIPSLWNSLCVVILFRRKLTQWNLNNNMSFTKLNMLTYSQNRWISRTT